MTRGPGHRRTVRQDIRLMALRVAGATLRTPPPQAAPRSILLIRPDHIGDVLLLTPVLHALRVALPHARLALAAGPWSTEVLRHNDDVDEIVTITFPGFERRAKRSPWAPYQALLAEARQLRARRFDAALVLRFDHWWGAWCAAAAGIPRRIGYAWPEVEPFLTQALPYVPGRHETLQNATLASALAPGIDSRLGSTRVVVTLDDAAWAGGWLAERGVDEHDQLVAIHPGAGAAVKQWPPAKWAAVGRALQARRQVKVVVTGGASERTLAAEVLSGLSAGAFNAAGETTLARLAALFQRCALVLGADSGPLHLAVATGTPSVHLYGPVPAAKFGPWGDPERHRVLQSHWACAPCDRLDWPARVLPDHGCVTSMDEEAVLNAALSMLGG